jgi:hypothetical protein
MLNAIVRQCAAAMRSADDAIAGGPLRRAALRLLTLTLSAIPALRSDGGLLYDAVDPAVAGGHDEGSD